jgi:hypothetical protein
MRYSSVVLYRLILWYVTAVVVQLPISQAAVQAGDECKTIEACAALGNAALQRSDASTALLYFRSQAQLAEDPPDNSAGPEAFGHAFDTLRAQAFDNLTSAFLLRKDYFRARAWARVAVRLDPSDALAKANLKLINDKTKEHRWSTDISGLYVRYAGYGTWDTLNVSDPDRGKVTLDLLANRMTSTWRQFGPASYGDVKGEANMVAARRAVYDYTDKDDEYSSCKLTLEFLNDSVFVIQQGLCGFGHGVDANGSWERICAGISRDCEMPPSIPLGPF